MESARPRKQSAYRHGLVAVEVDLVVLLQVLEAVGLVPTLFEQSSGTREECA
jgi:hypothetical protein